MGKRKYNTILDMGDYHLMLIKYNEILLPVLIDNEDVERVSEKYWRSQLHHTGKMYYIVSNTGGFSQLHRFIMNTPSDMVVDHINHNTLDNRKSNLRNCTAEENNNNRRKYANVSYETGCQGISVQYRVRVAGYRQRYFNSLKAAKEYWNEIQKDKECTDKKK